MCQADVYRGCKANSDDTGHEVWMEIMNKLLYPLREEKSTAKMSVGDRLRQGKMV